MAGKITTSSTSEYFAKNLQQVGFSSALKAVLTTLKESVDNSLDACEEHGILPELIIEIKKMGRGSSKGSDLIEIIVEDNGPGLEPEMLPKVFGEYLASSKFGRGQCSRGQQGIGISAATTWAQLTNAAGANVLTKTARMRRAVSAIVDVDIKGNKGILKNKQTVDWDKEHGVRVSFTIDGRIQKNGDGGLLTYLEGTTLVNPHLTLNYKLPDEEWVAVERVTDIVPEMPKPADPHPHTMKLGEFMTHAHLFGALNLNKFLKKAFSRVTDTTIKDFVKQGLKKGLLNKPIKSVSEKEFKEVFQAIQDTELSNPSTKSVLTIGEEGLSKSIHRLGEVDFFSVVTRKPRICDFKPVVVEVAIARFLNKKSSEDEQSAQLLRFANRVPLQFDRSSCAISKAIESVNWRTYGLVQRKRAIPLGPYVFAISVTSPFIKFKNASKETIDASDELVEEIRRALIQAGQKLSRHLKREHRAADLERKRAHIEKFAPIFVKNLVKIAKASKARQIKAEEGLRKILGRDSDEAESQLQAAEERLAKQKAKQRIRLGLEALPEDAKTLETKNTKQLQDKSASKNKPTKKSSGKNKASKKSASSNKAKKKTSTKKKIVSKKTAKKTARNKK